MNKRMIIYILGWVLIVEGAAMQLCTITSFIYRENEGIYFFLTGLVSAAIGVAAVKGIAFKNDLPCVSVSTLESMAYNMLGGECVVCAVMDARCSQVYNALFKVSAGRVERMCPDRALALTDLKPELERIDERIMLVGDGALICSEYLGNSLPNVFLAPVNNRFQKASSTALAAIESIRENKTITPAELMPTYLRLPQAQRELNKRLGRE